MREIIHEHEATIGGYAEVFAKLKALDPTARHVLVRLTPDEATPDGDRWEWLARLRHDVEGALRSFRYLAEKVAATYDPNDSRGRKVLESIGRHLATIEALKNELVDPLHDDGAGAP